ncbi:MAG: hypothetical protein IJH82_05765 [Lachnospiraceae bacterium]|nr:hypothetical protein [Lachnospiraceae bacterium]
MKHKYNYTVCKDNNPREFRLACDLIEKNNKVEKKRLAVDVDGSTIQAYSINGKEVVVFDDYDVGAVFVESDINLSDLFN